MNHPQRIYLDNAATSWPKPETVYQDVVRYMRELGAPAGRSGYREAAEVEQLIATARHLVAELLGVDDPSRIIFTANGTDSLNLALHGLLRHGDHVVTSVVEHNSVLRPLRELERRGLIQVTRVACDQTGVVDPDEIRGALLGNTRLIALIHASNVTGAIQPIDAVGRIAAEHDVRLLIDAAQSLGHVSCSARQLGADMIAAPGHKGLLGPLGTGVLYIAEGLEGQLAPVRQGGTGTQSEDDLQPETLPDRYESGNHNVPGIVGLKAGVEFLRARGVDQLRQHEQTLIEQLLVGLRDIDNVQVFGPADAARRVGVVSCCIRGYDPHEVASMLDAAYSIQVRSGLHCAPLMHAALNTTRHGGTVRFSVGCFNTEEEIDAVVMAVAELASTAVG